MIPKIKVTFPSTITTQLERDLNVKKGEVKDEDRSINITAASQEVANSKEARKERITSTKYDGAEEEKYDGGGRNDVKKGREERRDKG